MSSTTCFWLCTLDDICIYRTIMKGNRDAHFGIRKGQKLAKPTGLYVVNHEILSRIKIIFIVPTLLERISYLRLKSDSK